MRKSYIKRSNHPSRVKLVALATTPGFVAVVIIAVSGFANVIDIAGPVAAVAVKASGTGYHGLPGILNAIRS